MGMIFNARRLSAEELAAVLADPEKVGTLFQGGPDELDLDKAWHGLHYLLNGTTCGQLDPGRARRPRRARRRA